MFSGYFRNPIARVFPAQDATGVITYIWRDEYTTDDAAPITTPRTFEPGPGVANYTDASNIISISGGKQVVSGTPAADSKFVTNATTPWLLGKILSCDFAFVAPGFSMFGLNNNTTFGLAMMWGWGFYAANNIAVRDQTNEVGTLFSLIPTPLTGTYSIVMRNTNRVHFIKDNVLIWPSVYTAGIGANPAVYGGTFYNGTIAKNFTQDNFSAYTATPSALNEEYGIATDYDLAPVGGAELTSTADGTYQITWTPKLSETLTILFRRTDDDNCMKLVCAQAGGTIKLYERSGGSDSEINTGKTQTWTVGTAFPISISTWGTIIQTRVARIIKHNTTSTNQQTATTCKVTSSDATPTIAEFVTWPRELVDFPFV